MGAVTFSVKTLTSEIFQSAPNDTKLNSNDLTQKSALHMEFLGPRVPNFHPFPHRRFQDTSIAHFTISH